MRIAIIGAGFSGLSAGIELVDGGAEVVIFEGGDKPGGLAAGFVADGWEWSLESFYHHIFANDEAIKKLAEKIGWPAFFERPVTNSFIAGRQSQLDSPVSLLKFSELDLVSRIQMGAGLAILKIIRNGQFLERYRVVDLLPVLVGRSGYEKVWKRLLTAKFGSYIDAVNMAWFWSRVYKRTANLGYFEEGFGKLAEKCEEYIEKRGGRIRYKQQISNIEFLSTKQSSNTKYKIQNQIFDQVLITTPAPLVDKLIGEGNINWPKINYLWGQTLILEMDKSLMKGYWLNILEKDWPFLVAVEHTNFVDKSHYGDKVIIYLGNYLENGDERLNLNEKQLLTKYVPFLKKINRKFDKKWIKRAWKLQAAFAQPVFPTDYSKQIPEFRVKNSDIYVANMSMVYPFDRGTNYAVEMGEKVAKLMMEDHE